MDNLGFMTCLPFSLFFLSMGLVFSTLKGKAVTLLNRFNSLSKEEQKKYNREQISKTQAKTFYVWTFLLGIGAIASYFISSYIGILAFLTWLFLFLKDAKNTPEQNFRKYSKKRKETD